MTPFYSTVDVDDNSEHTVKAAVTGYYIHVNTLVVNSKTATAQNVTIRDGASGATVLIAPFAAAVGSQIYTFPGKGLRISASTGLYAISSSASASVQVSAVGYVDRV